MPSQVIRRARTLRRNQTEPERRLWAKLRDRRLGGLKFRRQQPCGPYIADFVCEDARLIVELDGSQHAEADHALADAERTRFLNELGFEVMRVWNIDVFSNMEGVLWTLYGVACARREKLAAKGEGNA